MKQIAAELTKMARQLSADEGQESVADKDQYNAKFLRPSLIESYIAFERLMISIDANLSPFNAPGLKAAFLSGLKAGMLRNDFDSARAISVLRKYIDRS